MKLPPKGSEKEIAHLLVKDGANSVDVYLCPKSFFDDMGMSFTKGDEIASHRVEGETGRNRPHPGAGNRERKRYVRVARRKGRTRLELEALKHNYLPRRLKAVFTKPT